MITRGFGIVGGLLLGGFGVAWQPPAPPTVLPLVHNVYPTAGGAGGSLPGDVEFNDYGPRAKQRWAEIGASLPGSRFWLNTGRARGTEATAGCADAGKVLETWTSDSEPRGAPGETAGCADAGKVHDNWKAKP